MRAVSQIPAHCNFKLLLHFYLVHMSNCSLTHYTRIMVVLSFHEGYSSTQMSPPTLTIPIKRENTRSQPSQMMKYLDKCFDKSKGQTWYLLKL